MSITDDDQYPGKDDDDKPSVVDNAVDDQNHPSPTDVDDPFPWCRWIEIKPGCAHKL